MRVLSRDDIAALATTKRVTLPFGAKQSNSGYFTGNTLASIMQRTLIALPVATTRWRLRVSNVATLDNTKTPVPGPVTWSDIYVGDPVYPAAGLWAGVMAAAGVSAIPGFVGDAAGNETITPWVTDPALQFVAGQPKALSWKQSFAVGTQLVGRSSASGDGGGGAIWFTPAAGAEFAANPGAAGVNNIYGEMRIEYELAVPVGLDTKIGLWITDSLGEGYSNPKEGMGNFVHETTPGQVAMREGIAMVNASIGTSTLEQWATLPLTDPRWSFLDLATTVPDFAVIGPGINDIQLNGRTFAQMQPWVGQLCDRLRGLGIKKIYATTLMPCNLAATPEGYRTSFNAFLRTCPFGISGTFEFAKLMEVVGATATGDPDYFVTYPHPKKAAYQRLASVANLR
ncbi:SGNH/GDSL hydrolase family protein [Sphingomonas immobilis]|uniref:SGNH/GDSL hydrolase family protein n=1 Tax=Sphingomonas immobilis TaxID=3063997 RepID=A0ABT8ZU15_9SPHN|nr:hypothetical protein [Sphingomonas sp. CA1-15]MDO7841059.1 hypothetical protein [Sphingomonas sp. CA1-15]